MWTWCILGANFGGSIFDVDGRSSRRQSHRDGGRRVKTAVFEMDMLNVGTIMSGDDYRTLYGDTYKSTGVDDARINSNAGSNFHPGIGNNGGGFGFDFFYRRGRLQPATGIRRMSTC